MQKAMIFKISFHVVNAQRALVEGTYALCLLTLGGQTNINAHNHDGHCPMTSFTHLWLSFSNRMILEYTQPEGEPGTSSYFQSLT